MSTLTDQSPAVTVAAAAGIGLVGFLVGLVFVSLAVSLLDAVLPLSEATPTRTAVTLVAQYSGSLAVVAFYLSTSERSMSFLRLGRPSARDVAWTVGGALALFVTLTGANLVIEQLGLSLTEHSILDRAEENPAILLPLIPLSVLVTGPVEELLYRGVVQSRLREAFATVPAVLIASVVFMLVHIPAYFLSPGNGSILASLAVLFVLGGVLGALYEHTGNLFVPAVAHGVYNAVTFANKYLELTGGL